MCSTLPRLLTCVLTCDTFGALRAHARDKISFCDFAKTHFAFASCVRCRAPGCVPHPCIWVTCVLGSGLCDVESLLALAAPLCHHHIPHDINVTTCGGEHDCDHHVSWNAARGNQHNDITTPWEGVTTRNTDRHVWCDRGWADRCCCLHYYSDYFDFFSSSSSNSYIPLRNR